MNSSSLHMHEGFQWYIDLVYRLLVARDRIDRHYRHMASGASGVVFSREDRREC